LSVGLTLDTYKYSISLLTATPDVDHPPGGILLKGRGYCEVEDLQVGLEDTLGAEEGFTDTLGTFDGTEEGFTDTLGTFDGTEEGFTDTLGTFDGAEEGFVDNEGISDGELELLLTRQRQQTSLALSFPSSAIPAAVAPHRSSST